MSDTSNPAYQAIRRYSDKYERIGEGLADFVTRQAEGESPDPVEFEQLLEAQSVTKSAMQAQYALLQKPLKTVLSESRG